MEEWGAKKVVWRKLRRNANSTSFRYLIILDNTDKIMLCLALESVYRSGSHHDRLRFLTSALRGKFIIPPCSHLDLSSSRDVI
jgi:hypothetical protein